MADEIKFRSLISTETGVGATTGRQTAEFFNSNFKITKENLEAIWKILETMVGSLNLEGIRIVESMNAEDPSISDGFYLEYTCNPDLTVDADYKPLNMRWKDLIGSPYLNNELAQILDSKTDNIDFIPIANQVNINTANIVDHGERIIVLENNDVKHDKELEDLRNTADDLATTLSFKADVYRGIATVVNGNRGTDYSFGDIIEAYPTGSGLFLLVLGVNADGGVTAAQLATGAGSVDGGLFIIKDAGDGYQSGDVVRAINPVLVSGGSGYAKNDIVLNSLDGQYYKILDIDGSGRATWVAPTKITVESTTGSGLQVDASSTDGGQYATVIEVGASGEILGLTKAEGDIGLVSLGSGANVYFTTGSGAQMIFGGYNTIMLRYNEEIPVVPTDPPLGMIWSIAGGSAGTWHSFLENIPFSNLILIKQVVDYSYNTLEMTSPQKDDLFPFAYGYVAGDIVTLDGITGLEVEIQAVDGNGTPIAFNPVTFNSSMVLSGTYNTTCTTNMGAIGLRFIVRSTPKTTNVEFNSYIDDLLRAVRGEWSSDVEAFTYEITKELGTKATKEELSNHVQNYDNPHQVTKEQIGLDAVDNTSDLDKPISTAQAAEFRKLDTQLKYIPRVSALSRHAYDNLDPLNVYDARTFYFVSRSNPPYDIAFVTYMRGADYVIGDTFTVIGQPYTGIVDAVDGAGGITAFTINLLPTEVDIDQSGLYSTITSGVGTGFVIEIVCNVIGG